MTQRWTSGHTHTHIHTHTHAHVHSKYMYMNPDTAPRVCIHKHGS